MRKIWVVKEIQLINWNGKEAMYLKIWHLETKSFHFWVIDNFENELYNTDQAKLVTKLNWC
jgi:hypothetical protein